MKIPPKGGRSLPSAVFQPGHSPPDRPHPRPPRQHPRRRVKLGSFLISSFVLREVRAQAVDNDGCQQPADGCSAQSQRAHISPTMNDCLVRSSEPKSSVAPVRALVALRFQLVVDAFDTVDLSNYLLCALSGRFGINLPG